jgi:acyl-CoA reductase-like NAD-dependent aldehyde dehydrogenase
MSLADADAANLIAGNRSRSGSRSYSGVDPRTGEALPGNYPEATPAELAEAVAAAADAAPALAAAPMGAVKSLLAGVAERLEDDAETLVATADTETALGRPRLESELARTCGQLRAFADAVGTGYVAEAIIDTARADASPPRPDLRRFLRPIGPVAVFGASNFPLAFGVAGGDTASALAARCPVVAKAHPSHPGTSQLVGEAVATAVAKAGLPAGTFSLLHASTPEGSRALVTAEPIQAVGFTGSLAAGRSLFDAAAARPEPIPVYAEMGSLNPVFLTAAALAARGGQIARDLVASVTMGVGQFCTKPGLVFLVGDVRTAGWLSALASEFAAAAPGCMLNPGLRDSLRAQIAATEGLPGVEVVARAGGEAGALQGPLALATDSAVFRDSEALRAEHFGPVTLVVRCRNWADLLDAAGALPGSLTATVHAEAGDTGQVASLLDTLAARSGRVIFNGYPTGVTVTAAMTHGGPYPAASMPTFTSVGLTAIRRFQRPVSFQSVPDQLLPPELQDANPLRIERWVDGTWTREPVRRVP